MIGVLLAAGYATRLLPLTADRPKALLPVHGRPIVDYLVCEMMRIPDINRIILISNHRFAAQFEAWAAGHRDWPIEILDDGTTCEQDRLGAIGDLAFAIRTLGLDDDLLVMAADNLFTYRLTDVWQTFRQHGRDMILAKAMPPDENLSRYAIVEVDANGQVLHLEEKPSHPRTNLAVFATYFYLRQTLPLIDRYLQEGNNPDAPGHFPAWLYRRKPVYVHFFTETCVDIGTPQSYRDVTTTFPLSVARRQLERCGGSDNSVETSDNRGSEE